MAKRAGRRRSPDTMNLGTESEHTPVIPPKVVAEFQLSLARARALLRGGFREVRIVDALSPAPCGGITVVAPGGIRIEGLDLAGTAALVRMLR